MAINGVGVVITGTTMDLLEWGADFGPSHLERANGGVYLAALFYIAAILHLLFNMYALGLRWLIVRAVIWASYDLLPLTY
jgi:hypothetical protein